MFDVKLKGTFWIKIAVCCQTSIFRTLRRNEFQITVGYTNEDFKFSNILDISGSWILISRSEKLYFQNVLMVRFSLHQGEFLQIEFVNLVKLLVLETALCLCRIVRNYQLKEKSFSYEYQ